MHSFGLLIGSVLGHPWAKAVVARSSKVVTYFRAAQRPLALLRTAANQLNIKSTVQPANKTRFTSVGDSLMSVKKLQLPLQSVVANHR